MSRLTILGLRALVILILLCAIVGQIVIIPAIGRDFDEGAHARGVYYPYAGLGIGVVACVELALVAVWMLLSMVRRGAIFTPRAFRWVDVIIGAGVAATLLVLAIAAHLVLVVEPLIDAPGLVFIAGGAVASGAAFVLLMVVMRGLLRSATALQSELEEVV